MKDRRLVLPYEQLILADWEIRNCKILRHLNNFTSLKNNSYSKFTVHEIAINRSSATIKANYTFSSKNNKKIHAWNGRKEKQTGNIDTDNNYLKKLTYISQNMNSLFSLINYFLFIPKNKHSIFYFLFTILVPRSVY